MRRESIPKVESPQENESKKVIEDNSEYVAVSSIFDCMLIFMIIILIDD